MPFEGVSDRWRVWREALPLQQYEARFAQLDADGHNVHGEADALERLRQDHGWTTPSVLDAGCGTGRIASELESRGWLVDAADSDPHMINLARAKSDGVNWHLDDLSTINLGRTFHVVLMAGNILLFVHEETEQAIMSAMAAHVSPGGLLVAGFSLREFSLLAYEEWCATAGLEVVQQWSTWDGEPYQRTDGHSNQNSSSGLSPNDYIVSIHQRRNP